MFRKYFILFIPLFLFSCYREVQKPPEIRYIVKKKKKWKEPVLNVLLYEGKDKAYISATAPYKIKSANLSGSFNAMNTIRVVDGSGKIYLFKGSKRAMIPSHIVVESSDGYVMFNNRRYRGSLLITEGLRVINRVPMEEYLLSVVPPEIGGVTPSLLEAAKSQAVAARTYALRKMLERKKSPFHLYASTLDQLYLGRDFETPWTDIAVKKTRGKIITYRREIVKALYHSTCGGRTTFFSEAFPAMKDVPYLRSVRCNVRGNDLCENSPHYRWKRSYSRNEFTALIARNLSQILGISIPPDEIKGIRISKRGRTGRAMEIKIRVGQGTQVIMGSEIRRLFTDIRGPLPSTWIDIKFRGNSVKIEGRGFGHGVGLCQYGSRTLSKMGWSYEKIIRFYFPGTKIYKIY